MAALSEECRRLLAQLRQRYPGALPADPVSAGGVVAAIHITPDQARKLFAPAAAIAAGLSSYRNARMFFQVFGVIYGLIAVAGFIVHPHAEGSEQLAGVVAINLADNFLHIAISLFSLFVGFAPRHPTMTVGQTR